MKLKTFIENIELRCKIYILKKLGWEIGICASSIELDETEYNYEA